MKQYETSHLVKQEDLNHHGTLFAARAAAWFVEAAFVAAGCEYSWFYMKASDALGLLSV